jgi:nitrogen-specific signal transduction histidine kinase
MRKASRLASSEDILAYAAHELRLPLSHIKGFVTSLGRTDVMWDDETRKEFISEIDRETDRLAELIDSLMSDRPGGGARFSVFLPARGRPEQFDIDSQAKDRGK